MANLPKPQNPFKLDAGGESSAPPREPFETNRHYVRNPHNGEWNLSIHAMIDGRVPFDYGVPVGPGKIGPTGTGIAAHHCPERLEHARRCRHYQVAFNQYNWHSSPALSRYRR
jgi:hypothetical protein